MAKEKKKPPVSPIPVSEESEKWVVGSLIKSPDLLGQIDLGPEDFSKKEYRGIFEAILSLRQAGSQLSPEAIEKEVGSGLEAWVIPRILAEVTTTTACKHHADIIKKASLLKKFRDICQKSSTKASQGGIDPTKIKDETIAELATLTYRGKSSRYVYFPKPESSKIATDPPTYELGVRTVDGKSACTIEATLNELVSRAAMKKKVIAEMNLNPIFPKNYDDLIDDIVKGIKEEEAPPGMSKQETVIYHLREWFKNAYEVEIFEELNRGFALRGEYYWIHADRMIKHIQDTAKFKLDKNVLWVIIRKHNAVRGKKCNPISIGGKKYRLWGIPREFFEAEETGLSIDEQTALTEKEEAPKNKEWWE